jgi:hypothetical protein
VGVALLFRQVKAKITAPLVSDQEPSALTPAELRAMIPDGHEIVMMLDTKSGCRVFTSSKRGDDAWEHEVLIPSKRLIRRVGCALEFVPTRSRPCRAA